MKLTSETSFYITMLILYLVAGFMFALLISQNTAKDKHRALTERVENTLYQACVDELAIVEADAVFACAEDARTQVLDLSKPL